MAKKFVDFFHLFDTKLCWSTHNTTHSNAVIFSFSSLFFDSSVCHRDFFLLLLHCSVSSTCLFWYTWKWLTSERDIYFMVTIERDSRMHAAFFRGKVLPLCNLIISTVLVGLLDDIISDFYSQIGCPTNNIYISVFQNESCWNRMKWNWGVGTDDSRNEGAIWFTIHIPDDVSISG